MLSSLFAGGDDNTAAGGVGGGQQSDPEAWTLQECSIPVAKVLKKKVIIFVNVTC